MNRLLLTGLLALAPAATAAELPHVGCVPAFNGPVCKKPTPLGDSKLQCELCTGAVEQQAAVDKGKAMTSFCDALRMISILSPCDEMREYDIAKTNQTTM